MTRETVLRPKGKLTAAWLDRVAVPEGCIRLTVKDSQVPGLEFRLSATGARSWAVSKRIKGRQRRFTIEDGARMSLAQARTAAIRLLDELAGGRDPTLEKREARKAARLAKLGIGKAWTLRELVEEYGAKVAQPAGQRTWDERRRHVLREYRDLLALPAAEITDAHLWRVLDAATARGARVSGMHGLRYLRTILKWAAQRKLIPADPTATLPVRDIRRTMRERPRERVLSADELARLWRAFEAQPHDPYSAIFRLLLLTGQRLGEVAGMRWGDLDLGRGEWRQRTNKSGRPHLVPLGEEALAIIKAQPRRGPFVFTTSSGGSFEGRKGNWTRASAGYAKAAKVEGWTRHDLRRTAATLLAGMRIDKVVIELLLNHAETGAKGGIVASTYNRHSYDLEKREAVERLDRHIRALTDGESAQVIEMRTAAAG